MGKGGGVEPSPYLCLCIVSYRFDGTGEGRPPKIHAYKKLNNAKLYYSILFNFLQAHILECDPQLTQACMIKLYATFFKYLYLRIYVYTY